VTWPWSTSPGTERAARAYLGTDDLQPVSRDELLDRIKSGQVLLVDVRPETEYAAGHIEGAASIPVDELYDRVSELPKGRDIVAYCRGEYCVFAHDAIRLLRSKGRSARRLQGGILEWRVEERPVVTDTA
jgi:rhodanese-related sulfurtransferase